MKSIKVKEILDKYQGEQFELYIKDRKLVKLKSGEYVSKLIIRLGKQEYNLWEPQNGIWVSFNPQVGMSVLCEVGVYEDKQFIKPIEQILVLTDTTKVLNQHDLPFEEGLYTIGVGLVSSPNKTKYVSLIDENGTYLIRKPDEWEFITSDLQYKIVEVDYKRTAQKGFLAFIKVVGDLDNEDIARLFMI